MNTEVNEAINQACNKLVALTFNPELHESFELRVNISPNMIYCSKFLNGQVVSNMDMFFVPKKAREISNFNARIEVFVKEILSTYSK